MSNFSGLIEQKFADLNKKITCKVLDDYTNKDGLERVMMTEGRVYHLLVETLKELLFCKMFC